MSPKDVSSWLALLEAAEVSRKHQSVLDVAKTIDENHIPSITYSTTENVETCLL